MRAYNACCGAVIGRWGGHVAKYMGDGVLAYYGWPTAHEGEAERAVRAALAIVNSLAGLQTPARAPLAARIGIASGMVMVGDLIGEGAATEQTVVGETPNLAARLEDHWRVLLRNQFHDILPGSSIREVYEQTEAELAGRDCGRRHGCG